MESPCHEDFAAFFRAHESRLRAFALRRTRSVDAADELVGAVMVASYHLRPSTPASVGHSPSTTGRRMS